MHIFAVYTHNVTQYTSSVHLLTVYVQWLQKAKNALIIISFFYLPHPPNIESFGNFRFELTVTITNYAQFFKPVSITKIQRIHFIDKTMLFSFF